MKINSEERFLNDIGYQMFPNIINIRMKNVTGKYV